MYYIKRWSVQQLLQKDFLLLLLLQSRVQALPGHHFLRSLCPAPYPVTPSRAHGAALPPSDTDHGMRCPALAAQVTLRHDILKRILRRAMHRAGIACALEPPHRRLPGLSDGSCTAQDGFATRAEAHRDILMVLPQGISIADVSVVHPPSINTLPRAVATVGAAESARD
jgi:hypothetical protein